MGVGDELKRQKEEALKQAQQARMAAFNGGANSNPAGQPNRAPGAPGKAAGAAGGGQPSFLDDWLAKRQQIVAQKPQAGQNATAGAAAPAPNPAFGPTVQSPMQAQPVQPAAPQPQPQQQGPAPAQMQSVPQQQPAQVAPAPAAPIAPVEPEKLHVREGGNGDDDGVSIKLR